MEVIKPKELTLSQKQDIWNLWNDEYPISIKHDSLDSLSNYLSSLAEPNHKLFYFNDEFFAWYCDFYRDNIRFFAMILKKKFQGQGFGSKILDEAKKEQNELNGWVVNKNDFLKSDGTFYQSPLNFYIKNGFEVLTNETFVSEQLSTVKIRWKNKS